MAFSLASLAHFLGKVLFVTPLLETELYRLTADPLAFQVTEAESLPGLQFFQGHMGVEADRFCL